MSNAILVTGASGPLGRQIVESLLTRVPTSRVAALCRDPSRVADLAARGVDVRVADYFDPPTLLAAMRGVDKLMLVSAPAFTDAIAAHHNVITAARRAGVRHVHFASVQRRPSSQHFISQVSDWNAAAERELASSGMLFTILRNTLYVDALDALIGEPDADGALRLPAGHARAAVASRADIAEATAAILASTGHDGRTYDLAGSHPVALESIAAVIATAYQRPVTYEAVSVPTFVAERVSAGQDHVVATFRADWFDAIAAGEFAARGVIEDILHRPPTDPLSFIGQHRSARARSRSGGNT